ncbi:hypothetical protein [Mycobacterium sp. DL440]|jgi:hypothetical protein|uniref:hypothetical protein n=1 Tax=Mycobacterium sp. DL440 TaxID=2675523 RepID=UPI001421D77C|nr:hypothetical protein [Mycobacterium sp. DL440]
MNTQTPTPPPWFEGLPKDERGFYVLAEAGWVDGQPMFSKFDMDRTIALAMHRACALCGYPMPKGHNVYRGFSQGDAAEIRMNQREHSHDLAGPLHLSCALYSAIVCPFLREKTARMGKDSKINPGGKRGSLAAVMGFSDFGLMVLQVPNPDPEALPPNFMTAYLGLQDDIRYRDGQELLERYYAAVESDREIIDMSQPRMFWGPTDADYRKRKLAIKRIGEVTRRTPVGIPMIVDSPVPYITFPL